MARNVFYSFHYQLDYWRVQQIRNIGAISGQKICVPNEWEQVKAKGDGAIQQWIDKGMEGRSTVLVLIGSQTADRKWVKYEIKKAWESGKAVLGIYIHNMKDKDSNKTSKGRNPFDNFTINGKKMSSIVKCYDPPALEPYPYIQNNIENWIEEAHIIRKNN